VFCDVCNAARNNKSDEVLNGTGFDCDIRFSVAPYGSGNSKKRYGLGGFFEFGLNSSFSLCVTLGYAKRTHIETSCDIKDQKMVPFHCNVYMHCLDPKVFLVWLPVGHRGGWFLYIGPILYFVLISSESNNVMDPGISPSDVKEENKMYKPTIFNGGLGLGFEYEILQSGIRIGIGIESFALNCLEWGADAKKQTKRMSKMGGTLHKLEDPMIGASVFSVKFDILKMIGEF